MEKVTHETVDTQYGKTSVEVVECTSCVKEVARHEAYRFTMERGNEEHVGWACEHCAKKGPVAYPTRVSHRISKWIDGGSLFPLLLYWPYIVVLLLLEEHTDVDTSNVELF